MTHRIVNGGFHSTVNLGFFQDLLRIAVAWLPQWFAGIGVQNNYHDQRVGDGRSCRSQHLAAPDSILVLFFGVTRLWN